VTYAGERFVYTDATLEAQKVQTAIPIFFAAMGPQMLRLAARIADGVLLNVGASIEYVEWAVALLREGATAAGRSLDGLTVAAWLSVYITDDREDGLRRAREWLATMLSIPRQGELLLERAGIDTAILPGIRQHFSAYPHTGDREAAGREVPEGVAERLALVGSPDQVRTRIAEYRAAGVQVPVLGPAPLRALYGSGS
jgi:5,10-methylenetetrahydromethanopterin reductase